jgi:hypothetical protein
MNLAVSCSAALGEHDVGRLEIAVDEACAMRPVKGVGDLRGNRDRSVQRQRAFIESAR